MIGGMLAGFEEILGIEKDETYASIGRQRIAWWQRQPRQEVLL